MYLHTRSLTKRYGAVAALADCDLSVHQGEVFGLLGPNGAGKTTLLRLVLGFLRPTSGTARVDNLDCYADSVAVRRRLAYLPGDPRLFRRMRGRDVLRFFARLRSTFSAADAFRLADRLGLECNRRVANMSTGMRQKLALTIALTPDVPLVILDEPTSNLDPNVRSEVARLLREASQGGKTVVFSSHVLSEVEDVCDRVAIMKQGTLVHTQVIADLRRHHRIRAEVLRAMEPPPPEIRRKLSVYAASNSSVRIESPGDLAPILAWLASQPIQDLTIEPVGLKSVYEQFHPASPDGSFADLHETAAVGDAREAS